MLARARPDQQEVFGGSAGLADVAREQSERWGHRCGKGLAFEVVREGDDQQTYNHTLLGTVMSNLLRNALHYTEHGQVRLVLEHGGFRVEDTGVGIPVDQQERMFQPFVRVPRGAAKGSAWAVAGAANLCAPGLGGRSAWPRTLRQLLCRPPGVLTFFHIS